MEEDYFRDDRSKSADKYYFPDTHGLRSENVQFMREQVDNELSRIVDVIRILEDCPAVCADENAVRIRDIVKSSASESNAFGLNDKDFDDFKFWVKLPLPTNTIPPDSKKQIEDTTKDIEQRKQLYARYLYDHWVKRQDQARCTLYFECLSERQQETYYGLIMSSMLSSPKHPLLTEKTPPEATNERTINVPACTDVIVRNSATSGTRGRLSVVVMDQSGVRQTAIDDQDMFFSADHTITQVPSSRTIQITGVNLNAGLYLPGLLVPKEMPAVSVRYTGLLSTEIDFDAGISGSAVIYLQAVPQPGPEPQCKDSNAVRSNLAQMIAPSLHGPRP